MKITIKSIDKKYVTVGWDSVKDADGYALFWADSDSPSMVYQKRYEGKATDYTLLKSTHIPHWFYAEAYKDGKVLERSEKLSSGITYKLSPRLEKLNRGLVALGTGEGIFLAWRMFRSEVRSATETGMTGTDYAVYRNGQKIALVTDSTNYLDPDGKEGDSYSVSPVADGIEGKRCTEVSISAQAKSRKK